ncbi:hypothetical protein ID866_7115 [Astraeus odoratus]|nr:hypothetical protein ID866_7115 [Astraeus odoratus]
MIIETFFKNKSSQDKNGSIPQAQDLFLDDDIPPAYDGHQEDTRVRPIAAPAQDTAFARLKGKPTNFLSVIEKDGPIKGTYIIDPSLQVPPASLPPPKESEPEDRNNLYLHTRNGCVDVDIWLVGRKDSMCVDQMRTTLHLSSGDGSITAKVHSMDAIDPFYLNVFTKDGRVTVLLPRSFHGPLTLQTRDGSCTLSSDLLKNSAKLSVVDRTTRYFVGNYTPSPSWEGDELRVETWDGKIKINIFFFRNYGRDFAALGEDAYYKLITMIVTEKLPTVEGPKLGETEAERTQEVVDLTCDQDLKEDHPPAYDDHTDGSRAPANTEDIPEKHHPIKGTYIVDPSLSIPAEYLPALQDGETEADRKNLHWHTRDGSIDAEIWMVGHRQSLGLNKNRTTLHVSSRDGSVTVKVNAINNIQPFSLDALSTNGRVIVLLPRSFHGPIKLKSIHGSCSLSDDLLRNSTHFGVVDHTARFFVGDFTAASDPSQWKGDELRAETRDGRVKVRYVDEVEQPCRKPGFFSRFFSD